MVYINKKYEFVNCIKIDIEIQREGKTVFNKMPFIKLLEGSDLLKCNLFGDEKKINKDNEKCFNISTSTWYAASNNRTTGTTYINYVKYENDTWQHN